jgi:uncharacterized Zn finger protein (UPF0148 family)
MMPSLAEIVFNCPHCAGPLIARAGDGGRTTDCPHCHQSFAIPAQNEVINKETFSEPRGLRRILQEVRDSEWETIRRKLQETKGRVAALESEIVKLREEVAAAPSAPEGGAGLRESLEHLRVEVAPLREENAEMLRQLIALRAELDGERQDHEATRQQLVRLRARTTGRRTPFPAIAAVQG